MNDMILILNYSNEFSLEIARRLRAEQVYSRIISGMTTAAQIQEIAPKGVILSGEAASAEGVFDAGILELNIPVLALGHAAHMLLAAQGGASAGVSLKEKKANIHYEQSELFAGVYDGERCIKESLTLMLPPDVRMTASAAGSTIAFEYTEKRQYGVQFELERNDPEGSAILKNFARDICGCTGWWSLDAALHHAQQHLADAAAKGGKAVCAVSGGVDSTLAALLAHRVFGDRMTAIFVDTGLLREGEAAKAEAMFAELSIPLVRVERSGEILESLRHKRSMEEKRAIVVSSLEEVMRRSIASMGEDTTLILGTNYSDFLSSGSQKEHWNAQGIAVIEPLLELFKEEVRAIAARLGMSETLVSRKPFPALGLGARILGEITGERLQALRTAETIFSEEIREAGMDRKLYKYFPLLVDGNMAFGEMIVLRAVTLSAGMLVPARLPHDLIERTVQRIMEATPSVRRVFCDQTPTPEGKETFSRRKTG